MMQALPVAPKDGEAQLKIMGRDPTFQELASRDQNAILVDLRRVLAERPKAVRQPKRGVSEDRRTSSAASSAAEGENFRRAKSQPPQTTSATDITDGASRRQSAVERGGDKAILITNAMIRQPEFRQLEPKTKKELLAALKSAVDTAPTNVLAQLANLSDSEAFRTLDSDIQSRLLKSIFAEKVKRSKDLPPDFIEQGPLQMQGDFGEFVRGVVNNQQQGRDQLQIPRKSGPRPPFRPSAANSQLPQELSVPGWHVVRDDDSDFLKAMDARLKKGKKDSTHSSSTGEKKTSHVSQEFLAGMIPQIGVAASLHSTKSSRSEKIFGVDSASILPNIPVGEVTSPPPPPERRSRTHSKGLRNKVKSNSKETVEITHEEVNLEEKEMLEKKVASKPTKVGERKPSPITKAIEEKPETPKRRSRSPAERKPPIPIFLPRKSSKDEKQQISPTAAVEAPADNYSNLFAKLKERASAYYDQIVAPPVPPPDVIRAPPGSALSERPITEREKQRMLPLHKRTTQSHSQKQRSSSAGPVPEGRRGTNHDLGALLTKRASSATRKLEVSSPARDEAISKALVKHMVKAEHGRSVSDRLSRAHERKYDEAMRRIEDMSKELAEFKKEKEEFKKDYHMKDQIERRMARPDLADHWNFSVKTAGLSVHRAGHSRSPSQVDAMSSGVTAVTFLQGQEEKDEKDDLKRRRSRSSRSHTPDTQSLQSHGFDRIAEIERRKLVINPAKALDLGSHLSLSPAPSKTSSQGGRSGSPKRPRSSSGSKGRKKLHRKRTGSLTPRGDKKSTPRDPQLSKDPKIIISTKTAPKGASAVDTKIVSGSPSPRGASPLPFANPLQWNFSRLTGSFPGTSFAAMSSASTEAERSPIKQEGLRQGLGPGIQIPADETKLLKALAQDIVGLNPALAPTVTKILNMPPSAADQAALRVDRAIEKGEANANGFALISRTAPKSRDTKNLDLLVHEADLLSYFLEHDAPETRLTQLLSLSVFGRADGPTEKMKAQLRAKSGR